MALEIEEAKVALTKVKGEYAMYYNRQREPALVFAPGDRVGLDGSDITTNRPSSKLSHQCLGPFVVEACVGHGTYRLALSPHFHHLHPVFPVVKHSPCFLIPSLANDLHHPHPQLSLTVRKEYEVETILDS
jgi:hypothetical protein